MPAFEDEQHFENVVLLEDAVLLSLGSGHAQHHGPTGHLGPGGHEVRADLFDREFVHADPTEAIDRGAWLLDGTD